MRAALMPVATAAFHDAVALTAGLSVLGPLASLGIRSGLTPNINIR